jgi:FHA domain
VEFVFSDAGSVREHELSIVDPTARVSDLAVALGADPAALVVDGRVVPGSAGLRASGLVTGSTVAPVSAPPAARTAASTVEARVVGGLDAGGRLPLPPGETVVGRGDGTAGLPIGHSSISRRHAVIALTGPGPVTVTDLGSRNGIDVNGVLSSGPTPLGPADTVGVGGAALVRVAPVPDAAQRAALDTLHGVRHGWRIPFQRQARRSAPPPSALVVPGAPVQVLFDTGTVHRAGSAASHVSADVAVVPSRGGVDVGLRLADPLGPKQCELVVVGRDGAQQTAMTWSVPSEGFGSGSSGPLLARGQVGFQPGQIARFEIQSAGRTLLVIPA